MSDDWINDPYDEAPVHVLDDDGEPDDGPVGPEGEDGNGDDLDVASAPRGDGTASAPAGDDAGESRGGAVNIPKPGESQGDPSDPA